MTTGVPVGMTQEIVDYFKNEGIRVMMSIGGVTYTDAWDEALATDAGVARPQRRRHCAGIRRRHRNRLRAQHRRQSRGPADFIDAFRSIHPYDATGANHAARLTIDLAAGGRYLQELNRHATLHWLDNATPVLDYANAMVHRSSGSPDNWQEHVDGMPTYDPVIPPKAPNRFTGGLYLKGNMANCTDFYSSEQWQLCELRETGGAGRGRHHQRHARLHVLGRRIPVGPQELRGHRSARTPARTGWAWRRTVFDIPIPMEALRQD